MCAWIYVAYITHTNNPEKEYIDYNLTTYTTTELDKEVVSNSFHSWTLY